MCEHTSRSGPNGDDPERRGGSGAAQQLAIIVLVEVLNWPPYSLGSIPPTVPRGYESNRTWESDVRVEHSLLKRTHLSIRLGKLNHCTMDENNPVGAKCLEDAIVPPGHRGPIIDRCQPARCSNSIIASEHLPIWKAEHDSLSRLRDQPRLPPNRRAAIDEQIRDVELALRKADGA